MPKTHTRRQAIGAMSSIGAAGLAGCLGDNGGDTDDGTDADADDDDGGEEYPVENIEYIVPYATGGGGDTYTRALQPTLSDILGVDITVVNREGAGAMIGAEQLHNAEPDGYTVGLYLVPLMTLAWFEQDPGFDAQELIPTASFRAASELMVADADLDLRHDPEKAFEMIQEGEITQFGGTREGAAHQTFQVIEQMEEFNVPTGSLTHIAYDGSGETIQGMVAGEFDFTSFVAPGPPLLTEEVEAGNIDPVCWLGSQATDIWPDVPLIEDFGYPNIDYITTLLYSTALPPNTPESIANTWEDALEEAIGSDEIQEWSDDTGNPVTFTDKATLQEAFDNSFELEDLL